MNTSLTTPTVIQHDTSTDIDCIQFTFDAYVIFFGTMCVFGLVGNGLSWAVLKWDRRNSGRVATFLLQTMAVVDNLFLLTAGISHITTAVTLYIEATDNGVAPPTVARNSSFVTPIGVDAPPTKVPDYDNFTASLRPIVGGATSAVVRAYITAYVTVCVWPLVHITQLWAVWITVLVAFNRYVAICLPFQAHRLCTMRQVRYQAAFLGLSIILYNIPRWLEYKIIYTLKPVTSHYLTHYSHIYFVYNILKPILIQFYFLGVNLVSFHYQLILLHYVINIGIHAHKFI